MADAFDDYALSLSPWMYLRLDDTSGTSAVDASGNSQTGTYVNSPTLDKPPISFDQSGRSVNFNGTNQCITVPNHANFDAAEFTIVALLNITSLSNNAYIFHHGDNTVSNDQGYYMRSDLTTGKLTFATFYSSWRSVTTTNPVFSINKSTLVALNYTNSNIIIYKDGNLHENLAWSWGGKGTSNQTIKIGAVKDSSLAWYWPGFMSRIMFFNSSLTAGQIKALYDTMIVSYRGAPLEVGKPQTQNRFTRWGH